MTAFFLETINAMLNGVINGFVCKLPGLHFSDKKLWFLKDGRYVRVEPALKRFLITMQPLLYWNVCLIFKDRLYELANHDCFQIEVPVFAPHFEETCRCLETGRIFTRVLSDTMFDLLENNEITYDDLQDRDINAIFNFGFQNLCTLKYSDHEKSWILESYPAHVKNVTEVSLRCFCPIEVADIHQLIILYVGEYSLVKNSSYRVLCGKADDSTRTRMCLPGF